MRWMWIDRVVELIPRQRLVAIKNISLAEEHLHEHFAASAASPAMPIMPASLIVEGMAQSAGILVGHAEAFREKVILAKVTSVELDREALPGQILRYTATIQQLDAAGASTSGVVELGEHAADGSIAFVRIGAIDLMFSHIDNQLGMSSAGPQFPEHNFVFGDGFKTLLRMSGVKF